MKISQVLRESTTPQVTGSLIKFNFETKEFMGKCALGEMACKSGKPELELSSTRHYVDTNDIFDAYDIPLELRRGLPLFIYNHSTEKVNIIYNNSFLYTTIVFLNDIMKLTFKEIADFLEVTYDL